LARKRSEVRRFHLFEIGLTLLNFIRINRYVALKIVTAKSSATETESKILEHLSSKGLGDPGKDHVMTLLDTFMHNGPNGVHRCLVFDVMGPSTATMAENLPTGLRTLPRNHNQCVEPGEPIERRYPLWMARSILRQTLLGIRFLHENGVTHGDLQPGNILFSVKDLSSLSENQLAQEDQSELYFVKRTNCDGEVQFDLPTKKIVDPEMYQNFNGENPSAPRYISRKQPMIDYVDLKPPLLIKLSDFGGAFFHSEPPAKPVTPLGLRCPELVLGDPITQRQDVWSLGCLMFEFITGQMLFNIMAFPDEEGGDSELNEANDDHWLQFSDILGPLPPKILSRWSRSHLYYNDKGQKVRHYIGDLPEGEDDSGPDETLETQIDRRKAADLSPDEALIIKNILRSILQYDPTNRPSASELLRHPWFAGPDLYG